VAPIFVYGDSSQDQLVAIVVPKKEQVALLYGKEALSNEGFKRICGEKKSPLIDSIMKQLNDLAMKRLERLCAKAIRGLWTMI
jgi:long-subunit acyl-CoA synthetase (AMP-forming)